MSAEIFIYLFIYLFIIYYLLFIYYYLFIILYYLYYIYIFKTIYLGVIGYSSANDTADGVGQANNSNQHAGIRVLDVQIQCFILLKNCQNFDK